MRHDDRLDNVRYPPAVDVGSGAAGDVRDRPQADIASRMALFRVSREAEDEINEAMAALSCLDRSRHR